MSRITYITEIHHIDGDGKDAGVLYREMQPKEMDTDEIVNRERKELFYQAGSSYAVETGGRLKDIREVCTLERLKKYHEKYYHLNNMVINFR